MRVSRAMAPWIPLLLVALIAACGSDGPMEPDRSPFVAATVNGSPWRANFQADLAVADLMQQGRVLEVVGLQVNADESTQQISVQIIDYQGPGTYPLGSRANAAGFGYYVTRANRTAESISYFTNAQHTGTITIATVDTQRRRVSGTFRFRAQLQEGETVVTVSPGEFQERYVIE